MECLGFGRLFQNEVAFKDFCLHILAIVVGLSQMANTGQRYGNARKTFEEAVTVSNKHFALIVIDDRWELLKAIVVKRNEKEETRGTSASTNDEDTLRDEDDFREIDPSTKDATDPHRIFGTNLTWYSMYGKYCADYRGYGN